MNCIDDIAALICVVCAIANVGLMIRSFGRA